MKLLCRPLIALPLLALLVGCGPDVADPLEGVGLSVRAPLNEQNPFFDPLVAFVELTAEGVDIPENSAQKVDAYAPGKEFSLDVVPFGFRRQIRVGLWQKNPESGQPDGPMIGIGRTIPFDLSYDDILAKGARIFFPYVTRLNEFAAAVGETGVAAAIDARVGLTAEALPDATVMIFGGGVPKPASTDPWDPASYSAFSNKVLQYDPNLRAIGDVSLALGAPLTTARAFHASAAGINGLVAVSGGYTMIADAAKATDHVEYFDPTTRKFLAALPPAGSPNPPHLRHARAGHTMTRMFDNDDYFLVVGGKGTDSAAAHSWEIWHPKQGAIAEGQLRYSRWNHAAVRLPEKDGGFVMLIGGEGDDKGKSVVWNNFEVIRYDTRGNIAFVGNTMITCKVGSANYNGPPGDPKGRDKCPALEGQPGYQKITWEPLSQPLADNIARTLPGAVYVDHLKYHYIYIAGGFSDTGHSKPLDRIDIFDIKNGLWVANQLSLDVARGAPMVAASMVGPRGGQVLIAGGVGSDGKSVSPAEVVYHANPGTDKAGLQKWSAKTVVPGGSVGGVAFPLATGHIMVAGGASLAEAGMTPQLPILLYNPL